MEIIKDGNLNKLIPKKGYKLRDINDVYKEEYVDDNGNTVPEHNIYYSDFIYLASQVDTVDKAKEIYTEDKVSEV